jgi:hypothetical protein
MGIGNIPHIIPHIGCAFYSDEPGAFFSMFPNSIV